MPDTKTAPRAPEPGLARRENGFVDPCMAAASAAVGRHCFSENSALISFLRILGFLRKLRSLLGKLSFLCNSAFQKPQLLSAFISFLRRQWMRIFEDLYSNISQYTFYHFLSSSALKTWLGLQSHGPNFRPWNGRANIKPVPTLWPATLRTGECCHELQETWLHHFCLTGYRWI